MSYDYRLNEQPRTDSGNRFDELPRAPRSASTVVSRTFSSWLTSAQPSATQSRVRVWSTRTVGSTARQPTGKGGRSGIEIGLGDEWIGETKPQIATGQPIPISDVLVRSLRDYGRIGMVSIAALTVMAEDEAALSLGDAVFLGHLMDCSSQLFKVLHDPTMSSWQIEDKSRFRQLPESIRIWGTSRILALDIVEAALNGRPARVVDEVYCPESKSGIKRVLNPRYGFGRIVSVRILSACSTTRGSADGFPEVLSAPFLSSQVWPTVSFAEVRYPPKTNVGVLWSTINRPQETPVLHSAFRA